MNMAVCATMCDNHAVCQSVIFDEAFPHCYMYSCVIDPATLDPKFQSTIAKPGAAAQCPGDLYDLSAQVLDAVSTPWDAQSVPWKTPAPNETPAPNTTPAPNETPAPDIKQLVADDVESTDPEMSTVNISMSLAQAEMPDPDLTIIKTSVTRTTTEVVTQSPEGYGVFDYDHEYNTTHHCPSTTSASSPLTESTTSPAGTGGMNMPAATDGPLIGEGAQTLVASWAVAALLGIVVRLLV